NNTVRNDESNTVTGHALVPIKRGKVARTNSVASRVVKRALTEPVEAMAPVVEVTAGPVVSHDAGPVPAPASVPSHESGWYQFGRFVVGLALIITAIAIFYASTRGGIWAAYALSADTKAAEIFAILLVSAEFLAMILPTA